MLHGYDERVLHVKAVVCEGIADESVRAYVVVPYEQDAHGDSLRELLSDQHLQGLVSTRS
jgi:hypothetical protein